MIFYILEFQSIRMTIPKIVSNDIFEKALYNCYQEKVTVLGYCMEPVVPSGDNYTSDLFRATVTFKKGRE